MSQLEPALHTQSQAIRLVVFDVDGVLTDGKLWYSSSGEELKAFHVQDGSAIKLLQEHGIEVAIITGRQSPMVTRRAAELGIRFVFQGSELGDANTGQAADLIGDAQPTETKTKTGGKLPHYQRLLSNLGLTDSQVACVGDDIADLPLLQRCGLGVSVPNGHPAARQAAAHVTTTAGGQGVARELAEALLRAQDKWPY